MAQTFKRLAHPGDAPHLAIVLKRYVSSIETSYSPTDSPVFTGDPQAPTPPTPDNDTSIATTAFVKNQNYAPLAGPIFTGDPKAPTPTPGDNDTSVATTAFVHTAVAAAGGITQLTGDATAGPGSGSQALTLAAVNVNVGTWNNVTVNGKGLVTAGSNAAYVTGNQTITLSGDISGSGTTAIVATLPNVNANVGTFQGIAVNAKGQVTAAANQNYLTTATAASIYLPLAGGTLTGPLTATGEVRATGSVAMVSFMDRVSNNQFSWYATSNIARLYYGPNGDRLLLDGPTGNLGVGITPGAKFHVSGADAGAIGIVAGATKAVRFGADTGAGYIAGVDQTGIASFQPLVINGSVVAIQGNSTEAIRTVNNGGTWFWTAGPTDAWGHVIQHNTTISAAASTSMATTISTLVYQIMFRNPNGQIGSITTNGANTGFGTSSDARLKTNEVRAVDLTALRDTVIWDFEWLVDGSPGRGVFAQDQHAIKPEMIIAPPDDMPDTPWMADYSKMVPDLIVGWQKHEQEIADLKARIEALETALATR